MDGTVVGIDPGVNFGITVLQGTDAWVYNGKLTKREHSYEHAEDAVRFVRGFLDGLMIRGLDVGLVVVEGAAFRKTMGQVGLAEVRFGFYYGAVQAGWDAIVMPPMSARKLAFGNGKSTASDEWPLLNHNAADSLGLAIAGVALLEERHGIQED